MPCLRLVGSSIRRYLGTNITEHTFKTQPYKLHRLDSAPSQECTLKKDDALKMFEQMVAIRRIESESATMYKEKLIKGFLHLYSGQEACAVGIDNVILPTDKVISAYRVHGFAYLRGISPHSIFAELLGRKTGCSRGKGGSMHMYSDSLIGGNGIVGAQVPIGAGLAFSMKYKKENSVCVNLYGDGAANQGQVFETFNMAMLWKLPCIFICENNKYGMGTSVSRASYCTDYYTRGDYVPGLWLDGMDLISVIEGMKYAVDHCKNGNGPIVVEMNTYRYYGHSMSDPGTSYRSRDEVQSVRKNLDPILQLREKLVDSSLCTDDELTAIEKRIKQSIADDAKKALNDPFPDPNEMYEHVYDSPIPNCSERGCTL